MPGADTTQDVSRPAHGRPAERPATCVDERKDERKKDGKGEGKRISAPSPNGKPALPVPTHEDVPYAGTSDAQKLDLYLPENAGKDAPLIINVHGGSFRQGDKDMEKPNIAHQLRRGYAAASVNYRLTGEALFPAGVQDVKAAVRWLRAHAGACGFDPGRLVIWGESAGGYMAQMVAVTGGRKTMFDDPALGHADVSSAVQAAVVWYAPNNFGAMDDQFREDTPKVCEGRLHPRDSAASSESQWLGAALPTIPGKVRRADPLTYLDTARDLPPFSIATGDADCLVPHQQSRELHKAVRRTGTRAELSIVPGVGHGPVVDRAEVGNALHFLDRTFDRG
nr:alpha/beta hydrolase [Streptomyces sp. HNM0574]